MDNNWLIRTTLIVILVFLVTPAFFPAGALLLALLNRAYTVVSHASLLDFFCWGLIIYAIVLFRWKSLIESGRGGGSGRELTGSQPKSL